MNPSVRARLAAKFRAITADRLEKLNESFLELESNDQDAEALEIVLRELHSLKGESKMMGFLHIHRITHRIEELLHGFRRGERELEKRVSDVTLKAFDCISELSHGEPADPAQESAVEGVVQAIQAVIEGEEVAEAEAPAEADWERDSAGPLNSTVPAGAFDITEDVPAAMTPSMLDEGRAPSMYREGDDTLDPSVEVPGRPRAGDEYLRVERVALDHVTELASELLIMQSRTESSSRELRTLTEAWTSLLQDVQTARRTEIDPRAQLTELSRRGQQISKDLRRLAAVISDDSFDNRVVVEGLEGAVKQLRLFPISSLFGRFRRAARDLASEQGKEVRVTLTGEGVQVDKQVLDLLEDPLLHLIRNAIDHGVEKPQVRKIAGKRSKASLQLRASQVGSTLEIVVQDDGRGIDVARLKRIAVSKGLIEAAEAEQISRDEALDLIFASGFSTRAEVSELSGRGVGMAVVKENLESAGGSVSVETTPGHGTRFRLVAPISMVMSRVMVLDDSGSTFALPMELVRTAMLVSEEQVEFVGDARSCVVDGARIPLLPLGPVVGGAELEYPGDEGWSVIVVTHRGIQLGLLVERFGGVIQAVQRPLDAFLAGIPLFQGAISLPGGGLALLLNVPEVLREATGGVVARRAAATKTGPEVETILVVDDSEFTRDLVVGLIRQLGYRVVDAVNGRQGLDRFREERPALVFTDLDMPVLDGFGLLKELRALPEGRSVPVIVFSTRGSDDDKRRAAELGADAYLVKTEFREEMLRQTVNRFLAGE